MSMVTDMATIHTVTDMVMVVCLATDMVGIMLMAMTDMDTATDTVMDIFQDTDMAMDMDTTDMGMDLFLAHFLTKSKAMNVHKKDKDNISAL